VVVVAALEVSRGMVVVLVEVAMRVVLIRVDTCSLRTLEAVMLLTVLVLVMVQVMVMEATV
jgi:hypothetical protein